MNLGMYTVFVQEEISKRKKGARVPYCVKSARRADDMIYQRTSICNFYFHLPITFTERHTNKCVTYVPWLEHETEPLFANQVKKKKALHRHTHTLSNIYPYYETMSVSDLQIATEIGCRLIEENEKLRQENQGLLQKVKSLDEVVSALNDKLMRIGREHSELDGENNEINNRIDKVNNASSSFITPPATPPREGAINMKHSSFKHRSVETQTFPTDFLEYPDNDHIDIENEVESSRRKPLIDPVKAMAKKRELTKIMGGFWAMRFDIETEKLLYKTWVMFSPFKRQVVFLDQKPSVKSHRILGKCKFVFCILFSLFETNSLYHL